LYTGTAEVLTSRLKDSADLSSVAATVKDVVAASSPSQPTTKAASAALSSGAADAAAGRAMSTLMPTVRAATTAVAVGDQEVEGEGVPPGALRVVEGEGELLGEGRLVMDSLG
jgi:hypothetical protein